MSRSTVFAVIALLAAAGVGVGIALTPSDMPAIEPGVDGHGNAESPIEVTVPDDVLPDGGAVDDAAGDAATTTDVEDTTGADTSSAATGLAAELSASEDAVVAGLGAALLLDGGLKQKIAVMQEVPRMRADMTDARAVALVQALKAMGDDEARSGVMLTVASAAEVYRHPRVREYLRSVEDPRVVPKVMGIESRIADEDAVDWLISVNVEQPDNSFKGVARFMKVLPALIVNADAESDKRILESMEQVHGMLEGENPLSMGQLIRPKIGTISRDRLALYDEWLEEH